MSLQIKKKNLLNGAVDGSKILLQEQDNFKKLKSDGTTQDVFSVTSENKVEFQIPVHVLSDPTLDSQVANKHYVDLRLSEQSNNQEEITDSLQSQINSLPTPIQVEKTIDFTILSNGYFELEDAIDAQAIMLVSDVGTVLIKDTEYSATIVDGKTRISFSSDLLVGGEKELEIGEKVYLFYFPISGTAGGGSDDGLSASDVVINTMSGNQTLMAPSVSAVKEYVTSEIEQIELTPGPQGEVGPQGPAGPQGQSAPPASLFIGTQKRSYFDTNIGITVHTDRYLNNTGTATLIGEVTITVTDNRPVVIVFVSSDLESQQVNPLTVDSIFSTTGTGNAFIYSTKNNIRLGSNRKIPASMTLPIDTIQIFDMPGNGTFTYQFYGYTTGGCTLQAFNYVIKGFVI